jgi:hypothetical protein
MYFYAYPWQSSTVSPHSEESFYKHLWNNRPDLFWKAQVNRKDVRGFQEIPDDFKELLEVMLHPDP